MKTLLDNPSDLYSYLQKFISPKYHERKTFGEVFTPIELINQILDKLPSNVWTNPNLKWFDPSSGIGNFMIVIYYRLMKSLKSSFKDITLRRNHILQNMLFMSELNPNNITICKQIFSPYHINLYSGNTLELNIHKVFNIHNFDIIIGNPPFQNSSAHGDNKLYLQFTKFSINHLNDYGYLLFITPRNIIDYLLLNKQYTQYINTLYQLHYLAIETTNTYFPDITSRFVVFLLQKKPYTSSTLIEYLDNNIKQTKLLLQKGMKIPKVLNPMDLSILHKLTSSDKHYQLLDFTFGNKTQRIRKNHIETGIVSKKKTKTHIVKIIDTFNKTNPYPGIYYYYHKKDNDFSKDKLILSKKSFLMPFIDRTHQYTYSDNYQYILDDYLDEIKLLLESILFKYLAYQYSINGFDLIHIIPLIAKKDICGIKNESDLFKIYNLTNDEIKHIQNITK